ncbi:hypothetical protein [Streptomyces sp. NPDC001933]|uniref:hypothetical protein n=1 Tax=Streptomyces sp. NPDC001933 TaxID=3364626 RepID=UPI00368A8212
MATGQRVDPFAAFNFTLTIDGLEGSHGCFSECSGANTEQDVIEYREGMASSTRTGSGSGCVIRAL